VTQASFFSSIRDGYDTIAEDYFSNFPRELPGHPVDAGMLDAFVGLVRDSGLGPVADVGLPAVFAGFHQAIAPGGHLLLAFQTGDEFRVRTEAHGHQVSIAFYLRPPERVAGWLGEAGFGLLATLVREIDADWEKAPRAFLLARKPSD
jgi:hypothetical protein